MVTVAPSLPFLAMVVPVLGALACMLRLLARRTPAEALEAGEAPT